MQQQGIILSPLPTSGAELVLAIFPAYFSDPSFEIPAELKETTFHAEANQQTSSSLGKWDMTREVATLTQPVLLLWGEDDPFGRPMAEATKEALSSAQVEFVLLKGCGHYWRNVQASSSPLFAPFWGLHLHHRLRRRHSG